MAVLHDLLVILSNTKQDFSRSIQLYEALIGAGASMLTIHGRTREEKGHWVREADWNMIARVKAYFANHPNPFMRVPIVANGGIENMDDVLRCLQVTKADAVMSSEAVLENPALFARNISPETGLHVSLIELAGIVILVS